MARGSVLSLCLCSGLIWSPACSGQLCDGRRRWPRGRQRRVSERPPATRASDSQRQMCKHPRAPLGPGSPAPRGRSGTVGVTFRTRAAAPPTGRVPIRRLMVFRPRLTPAPPPRQCQSAQPCAKPASVLHLTQRAFFRVCRFKRFSLNETSKSQ